MARYRRFDAAGDFCEVATCHALLTPPKLNMPRFQFICWIAPID
jgi:hypothetical protein